MIMFARPAGGASAYSRQDLSAFQPPGGLGAFDKGGRDALAREWSRVIDELLRIRTLEDDWDGEGTEAPHPALVDGAITLAQDLEAKGVVPPDRVHAGANATVYFEWHTPHGYNEVEVVSPIDAEIRWVPKGSDTAEVMYLTRRP